MTRITRDDATPPLSSYARLRRFAWRRARKRELEGVPVGVFLLTRDDGEAAFEKVGQALALLRRYCPRRFARLRRDVGCVLIDGAGGFDGRWIDALRLCELDERFVLDASTSPAAVAGTLVHEAMHARLCRRGFGYGEGAERARVEAACCRAERAFARRLPAALHGPEMAAQADGRVRALEDAPTGVAERYVSDDAYFEAGVTGMRDAGVPEWLVQKLVAFARWRQRRRE